MPKPRWFFRFCDSTTFLRFMLVGIGGVAMGTLLLWFLTNVVHMFYLFSASLAALCAVTSDFFFNNLWTFSHKRRNYDSGARLFKLFAKFTASKAIGFSLSLAVLAFFTQAVGFHYMLSNIFAIGVSFVWNYTMSSRWVWVREK